MKRVGGPRLVRGMVLCWSMRGEDGEQEVCNLGGHRSHNLAPGACAHPASEMRVRCKMRCKEVQNEMHERCWEGAKGYK